MNRSEFQDFYEANRDACLRSVLAVVGDRQLAEDVVAEAFTVAFASWPVVRRHPVPRAWVVRTALNTRVSWWRRRRHEVVMDGVAEVAAAPRSDPAMDPALLAVLRRLPQRQREVIALRVFLDLDTRTTASVLGLAQGTVKAHLSRAVATLREQLIPTDQQEASDGP